MRIPSIGRVGWRGLALSLGVFFSHAWADERPMLKKQLAILGLTIGLLLVSLLLPMSALTQEAKLTAFPLQVGVRQAPPFVIKTDNTIQKPNDGWIGIRIALWQSIAAELDVAYEFRELDLQHLLDRVQDGSLDVAIGALTITAERETVVDFTHPFHSTGLGIAVARNPAGGWLSFVRPFFSWQFVQAVSVFLLVLFVVGWLIWLCKRNDNLVHFGWGLDGLFSGVWWSAVTMTTVGYGDKVPVTVSGRIIGLVWMFTSIILISSFTAAITAALTVNQLESSIHGPRDLLSISVATVPDSTSAAYLRQQHIAYQEYATAREGLRAVAQGEIPAMVYDAPLLRYLATTEFNNGIEVLPATFERQDYGIALPPESPLRESINRVLLKETSLPRWQVVLQRYLGGVPHFLGR